jgi:F0F1-type ATP synthase alpha subunit
MKPDLKNKYLVSEMEREKKVNFLISISLSGFNPPPPKQKFNGDLFYIHARTLEGQDLHITASP